MWTESDERDYQEFLDEHERLRAETSDCTIHGHRWSYHYGGSHCTNCGAEG